jgi:hypothetical protein
MDVLSEMVVSNYNHTVHRTIGIPPAEVTWANQTTVSRGYMEERDPKNRANFLLEIECDSAKPSVCSRKDTYLTRPKNCLP